MVCIVILNWNGTEDTLACLESLRKTDFPDYFVVLGDNGSTDNSLSILEEHLKQAGTLAEKDAPKPVAGSVYLVDLKENHGFSQGNNLLLKYAARFSPDCYLLLNNDTVVKPDFLSRLIRFSEETPQYRVLTPLILYYDEPTRVWNGGGNIFFGLRKYHYSEKFTDCIKEKSHIPCSYITGCAMFFFPELLSADGSLFTERFFHGEEDFELALRLKKAKTPMACVVDSIIFHKVGRATRHLSSLGKTYAHYLSRFIDMKQHLSVFGFFLWRNLYVPYIFRLLRQQGTPSASARRFLKRLMKDCRRFEGVNREMFFNLLSSEF